MKAQELRIGNLVIVPEEVEQFQERKSYSYKHVFEVVAVFKNSVKVDIGLDCVQSIQLKEIEAIPLTEEWLLKFEFKLKSQFAYDVAKRNNVVIKYGQNFFYDKIQLEYVHQLQNLYFALTGKELTIKEQ